MALLDRMEENGSAVVRHGRQMFALNRGDLDPLSVLIVLPAIAACLVTGVLLGDPLSGMVAGGGAFVLGFGAFQRFTTRRAAPMVFGLAGVVVATFLGAWSSSDLLPFLLVCGLFAAINAAATPAGQGAWWVTSQWGIAAFLGGAFPADFTAALHRAGLVLVGGLLQLLIVTVSWRLRRQPATPDAERAGEHWRDLFRLLRRELHARGGWRYPVLVTLMIVLAVVLMRIVPLAHGYWIPLSALMVIKPQADLSSQRVFYRVAGTLAGAGVATLIAALLRPNELLIAIIAVVLAGCAYALQRSGYAAMTTFVTATVAFFAMLLGLPELQAVGERIAATLIGGALALVATLTLVLLSRTEPGGSTPARP